MDKNAGLKVMKTNDLEWLREGYEKQILIEKRRAEEMVETLQDAITAIDTILANRSV